MCPPAVILAAGAVSALGSVYSGFSQARALRQSAAVDRANAGIFDQNALNVRNAAASTRSRITATQSRPSAAAIRNNAAASGVEVDTGSSLEAQIVNARNNTINELDALFKGDVEAQNQRMNAFNARASAANKESQAGNAITAGFLNAAASIGSSAFMLHQVGGLGSSLLPSSNVPANLSTQNFVTGRTIV